MSEELNYQTDCQIDENALDVEWLNHASLAIKYCKIVAELEKRVELIEEKVKVCRSQIILEVFEDPEGTIGKQKPTGPHIESYYRTRPRYRKLKKKLIRLRYDLSMAQSAKEQICFARKEALKNMVLLHGQQYFAGPSVPRNLKKEVAKQKKERDAKIGKKLRKDDD